MEALYLRILSFVLSVLMGLFNSLSAAFPALFPVESVENNVIVCDGELLKVEDTAVISDYVSWYKVSDRNSEELERFDWKYFFTRSVAVVKVTLPNPGCTLSVDSVKENGEILEIVYSNSCGDGEYAAVEVPEVIVVETSKNIKLISAEKNSAPDEPDVPEIPEIPDEPEKINGFSYNIYNSDNFNPSYMYDGKCDIIGSYSSWQSYCTGTAAGLKKYDEAFFGENRLAVVYISVPEGEKNINLTNIKLSDNGENVFVYYRVVNGESDFTEGMWAAVVEIGNGITYASATEIGIKGGSVLIDGGMFNREYFYNKEDGAYIIVSSYNEFSEVKGRQYMTDYYFNADFFKDTSLALTYVMLPDENYSTKVASQKENGSVLELEYTTYLTREDYYDDRYEAVKYMVVVSEISKDITEVKAVEKSFKNIYKTYYVSKFTGMTDNPQLISDYETWLSVCSSSSSDFAKYDEEFFENESVVLIGETMPDSGAYFDVIKLRENGETLEVLYGIDSLGGLTVLEHKVLLIEVSKNIKSVSAERRDIRYSYETYYSDYSFNFDDSMRESAVLITDYESWQNIVDPEYADKFTEYDEAYFENKSVVLLNAVAYGGRYEEIVRYLCDEDGVFYAGVNIYEYRGVFGLAFVRYKTILVEVDKDITSVQYDLFS